MNDINRLVIFLLLIALIYALYKYQNLIMDNLPEQFKTMDNSKENRQLTLNKYKKNTYKQNKNIKGSKGSKENKENKESKENKYKQVTIDNISQISVGSLENEPVNNKLYKQDSVLGSLASESGQLTNNSEQANLNSLFDVSSNGTNNSQNTKDSFFF